LLPDGYENVTFPPAVIVTDGSPVVGFSNPKSKARIEPSTSGALALDGTEASP
jgi:hypothetical protein